MHQNQGSLVTKLEFEKDFKNAIKLDKARAFETLSLKVLFYQSFELTLI